MEFNIVVLGQALHTGILTKNTLVIRTQQSVTLQFQTSRLCCRLSKQIQNEGKRCCEDTKFYSERSVTDMGIRSVG